MFKETGFWQLISHGGVTLVILIGLSLWSWMIIYERWRKFAKAQAGSDRLSSRVAKLARAGQISEAKDLAASEEEGALGRLLHAGLAHPTKDKLVFEEAMDRKMTEELALLERRLGALGTIGSVAPYIGLFGTVLGIITAFQALARSGQEAGAALVSAGIAEALVATAAGLAVAVPAVVFYNSYSRGLAEMETKMNLASSELAEALFDKAQAKKVSDEE